MAYTNIAQPAVRPKRPLGIWIFTVIHVLGGLISIAGVGILLLTLLGGGSMPGMSPNYYLRALYSFMMLFIIIGVWLGHNPSRIALLSITTLYYGGSIGLLLLTTSTRETSDTSTGVLSGLFYMLLYLWYFRRPQTVAFFQR